MNLLQTRSGRRVLFTGFYFLEGAPIGFLWWSLPSLLRAEGVGNEAIGAMLGWLVLPWALKWLWAPLVDLLQSSAWTLRAWIGAAQLGMLLTLLPLLLEPDLLRSSRLVPWLLAHAVCAATQDAAIDALMIRSSTPDERGGLAGWMQVGMLAGRSLLGGGALLLLPDLGGRTVIGALLAVILVGLGLLLLFRAPAPPAEGAPLRALRTRLGAALARPTTWLGLSFAAVAGVGFEALGAFAGPLLTERAGGDTQVAGRFFLVHAVAAMALGGLAGGRLTDRLGARRGTLLTGALLGSSILATAAVLLLLPSAAAAELVPWLTWVYLCIGGFTAASYALFMGWTEPRLGATQFSAYMGATNLCEAWSAALAGRMINGLGHGTTFGSLALLGLLALPLVLLGRSRHDTGQDPTPKNGRQRPPRHVPPSADR